MQTGVNPTIEELRSFFDSDRIGDADPSRLTAPTYYACMLIRCNALARLPLKVKAAMPKGGARDLTEHSLYELLHLRPNSYTSIHDLLWATEFQRLHYGNAYWVKDFSNGGFKAIYLLDSSRVRIYVDDGRLFSSSGSAVFYAYSDSRRGEVMYASDEIAHFKNFSSSGIVGRSVRSYLGDVIANEQYAGNVIGEKYKNGLQDPLIVTYTGDLNSERQKKIQKKFSDMGGAKNAGRVIPIPTEFGVTQLETKLVNSQFFELNTLTSRQIANAFGVKSFQLNDLEKSTYSNITQQNAAFLSDTLLNVVTLYEQEMDYKLLFREEREKGVFTHFNTDVMLRADTLTRYQAYEIAINSGFSEIAEVRAKEDMPFVNGTDMLIFGNGAAIPLSQLGIQYGGGVSNGNDKQNNESGA